MRRCLWVALRPAVRKPCSPRSPEQVGHTPKPADCPPTPAPHPFTALGSSLPARGKSIRMKGHDITASICGFSSGGKGVMWSSLEKSISGVEFSALPEEWGRARTPGQEPRWGVGMATCHLGQTEPAGWEGGTGACGEQVCRQQGPHLLHIAHPPTFLSCCSLPTKHEPLRIRRSSSQTGAGISYRS